MMASLESSPGNRFLGNRRARCSASSRGYLRMLPTRTVPHGMNRRQPTTAEGRGQSRANQKELGGEASRLYGMVSELKEQARDVREFQASRPAREEGPERRTGRTRRGSGQRLIEHLLCFHGKPRERTFCGKEKFFHLFLIDFPLQAKESCVSLKTSKRRGTFQGITERGT